MRSSVLQQDLKHLSWPGGADCVHSSSVIDLEEWNYSAARNTVGRGWLSHPPSFSGHTNRVERMEILIYYLASR